MEKLDFDRDFKFVYDNMQADLIAYGQNIKEMEDTYGSVRNFFEIIPTALIEWKDWFLGK